MQRAGNGTVIFGIFHGPTQRGSASAMRCRSITTMSISASFRVRCAVVAALISSPVSKATRFRFPKPSLQLLDDIFKLVCVVEVLVRAVLDGIWEDTCHDDNLYADLWRFQWSSSAFESQTSSTNLMAFVPGFHLRCHFYPGLRLW